MSAPGNFCISFASSFCLALELEGWTCCAESTAEARAQLRLRSAKRGCTTSRGKRGATLSESAGPEAWWSQAGSNRRPLACHASALPAELWPHARPAQPTHGLGPCQARLVERLCPSKPRRAAPAACASRSAESATLESTRADSRCRGLSERRQSGSPGARHRAQDDPGGKGRGRRRTQPRSR